MIKSIKSFVVSAHQHKIRPRNCPENRYPHDLSQSSPQSQRLPITFRGYFQGTTFTDCNFEGAKTPWKVKDYFSYEPPTHFLKCKFFNCNLKHVSFFDIDMTQSSFNKSQLNNANLSGANLSGTNFYNADLSGANLSGANLSGANFQGSTLENIIIDRNTNLQGAKFCDKSFSELYDSLFPTTLSTIKELEEKLEAVQSFKLDVDIKTNFNTLIQERIEKIKQIEVDIQNHFNIYDYLDKAALA